MENSMTELFFYFVLFLKDQNGGESTLNFVAWMAIILTIQV